MVPHVGAVLEIVHGRLNLPILLLISTTCSDSHRTVAAFLENLQTDHHGTQMRIILRRRIRPSFIIRQEKHFINVLHRRVLFGSERILATGITTDEATKSPDKFAGQTD